MKWEKVEIGKVSKVISGFAFKSKDFQPTGTPVIKIKNIKDEKIVLDESDCVDSAIDIPVRFHLSYGDVLISLTGSHITLPSSVVGRVAKYRHETISYLNQRAGKFINIDNENCFKDYLFYFLLQKETLTKIANKAQGAANQANISPGDVEGVEIDLPPLPTQRKIASILSAYDDLIENNLKRIKLLEEKAFVSYKFLEKVEKYRLSDLYGTSSGGTPSRTNAEYFVGEINWFKSKELADSILLESEEKITETAIDKSSAKLFPTGSVIMAMYGATIGKLGLLSLAATTNQACCAITQKDDIKSNYYIFNWLLENREYVLSFRMGAAQENISQQVIKNLLVSIPKDRDLQIFNAEMKPIYQLVKNLRQQNTKLREARDILLPRLMSGEVEV
jgi:type I restriction enzyme S subunit